MNDAEMQIRVLLLKEDGLWIAQCLEYDIVAQAATLPDVKYELERLLVGHIVISLDHGLVPFANMPSAPETMRRKFEEAQDRLVGEWPEWKVPEAFGFRLPSQPEVRVA